MCPEHRRKSNVINSSSFLPLVFCFPQCGLPFAGNKADPWQLLVYLWLRICNPREKLMILFCPITNLRKGSDQLVWVLPTPVASAESIIDHQNLNVRVGWQCQKRWGTEQKNQIISLTPQKISYRFQLLTSITKKHWGSNLLLLDRILGSLSLSLSFPHTHTAIPRNFGVAKGSSDHSFPLLCLEETGSKLCFTVNALPTTCPVFFYSTVLMYPFFYGIKPKELRVMWYKI